MMQESRLTNFQQRQLDKAAKSEIIFSYMTLHLRIVLTRLILLIFACCPVFGALHSFFNHLRGRAVKCYTFPSKSNLRF